MLKFGVVDLPGLERPKTWFGSPRDVALPVLWEAMRVDPERYGKVCAEAFNRLRMGNGVYKYTAPRRFDDVKDGVAAVLRERLPKGPLSVLDLGVSDGVTSVEWFAELVATWPDLRFTMSDWFDAAYVFRRDGDAWAGVLDAEMRPVQYFGRGFVLTPTTPPGRRYPVNRAVLRRLVETFEPAMLDAARALRVEGDRVVAPPGWSVEKTPLICRAALDLVRSDPRATFIRLSVLDPAPGRYRVVRAMNVLNRGYFSEADLKTAVGRVRDALDSGGVFLVGRNIDEEDGRTTATAYVKTDRGFEVAARFHGGSELEPLVK
jgi:hypothetical protein